MGVMAETKPMPAATASVRSNGSAQVSEASRAAAAARSLAGASLGRSHRSLTPAVVRATRSIMDTRGSPDAYAGQDPPTPRHLGTRAPFDPRPVPSPGVVQPGGTGWPESPV